MSVFISGVTGCVGKHLLMYFLKQTDRTLVVCIRVKKGKCVQSRFQEEIVQHALFKDPLIQARLKQNVVVIAKDVNDLTKEDLQTCSDVVHCAANVKFTVPLEELYHENVTNLIKLYKLCKKARFYYISTCYVHPQNTSGPYHSVQIPSGLTSDNFICNYAYTKYLAESYLYNKKGFIDIIRLSCVGAPIEPLPPIRGGAHLSFFELLLRHKIPDLWVPENLQLSVVPVDVACKGIVNRVQNATKEKEKEKENKISIAQYSAPPHCPTYNIKILNYKRYHTTSAKLWRNISYEKFIAWLGIIYYFSPNLIKNIIEINNIISYICSNLRFHSDISLPHLTPDAYNKMTFDYVNTFVKNNSKKSDFWRKWLFTFFSYFKTLLEKLFHRFV